MYTVVAPQPAVNPAVGAALGDNKLSPQKTHKDMKNLNKIEQFALDIKCLFEEIFHRWHKRKAKCSNKLLGASEFCDIVFARAKKLPLLQLIDNRYIKDLKSVDIRVKIGDNYISDADLDLIIEDAVKNKDALYVVVTRGNVSPANIERVDRAFWDHYVVILCLGDPDVARIKKWILNGNINACIFYLYMFTDAIAHRSRRQPMDEYRRTAIEKRLDFMGNLKVKQFRTLVKKLEFLLVLEEVHGNFSKASSSIDVTRKTIYNWRKTDPVFKELLGIRGEFKEEDKYWRDDTDDLSDLIDKHDRDFEKLLQKNDKDWDVISQHQDDSETKEIIRENP
ncbi:MAG: hypothetical protein ABIG29_00955 [Candidatus Nealsonbacteria bacterium]